MYLAELKGPHYSLAVEELESVGEAVERHGDVALCQNLDVTRYLGMTHRVSEVVAEAEADVDSIVAVVDAVELPEGSVRVRANVEHLPEDTEEVEKLVGERLYRRGHSVDLEAPDHEVRVVTADDTAYICLRICETLGFNGRAPTEKPFFKPGSMSPVLARTLSNVAGGYGGASVLDPTCGTGGVLVEAALAEAEPVGGDVDPEMVEGARVNLEEYTDVAPRLYVGDAASLPLQNEAVDCAVTDLPYGRASKVGSTSLERLRRDVLTELNRVTRRRVVAVADEDLTTLCRDVGYTVSGHHTLRVHRSLDRHVHVLDV